MHEPFWTADGTRVPRHGRRDARGRSRRSRGRGDLARRALGRGRDHRRTTRSCRRPRGDAPLALPKTSLSGEAVLADIGLPTAVYERAGVDPVRPFGDGWRVELTSS